MVSLQTMLFMNTGPADCLMEQTCAEGGPYLMEQPYEELYTLKQ